MLRALGQAASLELCSDLSAACINEGNSDLCCWPKASPSCKKCSTPCKGCVSLDRGLLLVCPACALSLQHLLALTFGVITQLTKQLRVSLVSSPLCDRQSLSVTYPEAEHEHY